jgi:hypothetical protein
MHKVFPNIDGHIVIHHIEDELIFPEKIDGSVVCFVENVKRLVLPKRIKQGVHFERLQHAENLILPEYIEWSLNLPSLTDATGVTFPKKIAGTCNLSHLKTGDNVILPEYIGGDLLLNSLTTNIVLPTYVGLDVYLCNLKNIENLILPVNFRRIHGEFVICLDKKLYLNHMNGSKEVLPNTIPELLERNVRIPRKFLVEILSKTYSPEETAILVDNILAAQMLTNA